MKSIRPIRSVASVLIAGILLITSGLSARAQSASDLSGFVGQWRINLTETKLNRNGPNGKYTLRDATYTNVISVQGQDLKMDVFEHYPQSTPDRSTNLLTDEKEHPANASGKETYAYFKIDSHALFRLTRVDGKPSEYMAFGLSADGKTMTQVIWSPPTPEWQTVYVYNRQ